MIIKETFLICDGGCGFNFGVDNRSRNSSEQRKAASLNGWIYSGNKDLCPNCRPKRKDGQNPKSHIISPSIKPTNNE